MLIPVGRHLLPVNVDKNVKFSFCTKLPYSEDVLLVLPKDFRATTGKCRVATVRKVISVLWLCIFLSFLVTSYQAIQLI